MFFPRLIEQINEDAEASGGEENSFPLSPIAASVILTSCSTVACIACFWVVQGFGRKTLLVFS